MTASDTLPTVEVSEEYTDGTTIYELTLAGKSRVDEINFSSLVQVTTVQFTLKVRESVEADFTVVGKEVFRVL